MRPASLFESIRKNLLVTPEQRAWARQLRIWQEAESDSAVYRTALNGFLVYMGDLEEKGVYYIKTALGQEKPFSPKNLEGDESLPHWAMPSVLFDIVTAGCTEEFNLSPRFLDNLKRSFRFKVRQSPENIRLSKNANEIMCSLAEKFKVPEYQVLRWATGYYAAFMQAAAEGDEIYVRYPNGRNVLLTYGYTDLMIAKTRRASATAMALAVA